MVAKVGSGDASYDISLHPHEIYGRHPEHPLTEVLEAFPGRDRNSPCPAGLFTTCSAQVYSFPLSGRSFFPKRAYIQTANFSVNIVVQRIVLAVVKPYKKKLIYEYRDLLIITFSIKLT